MSKRIVTLLVLSTISGSVLGQSTTGAKLHYPIVPGAGGVVKIAGAVEPPRKGARVILDITSESEPAVLHKGLNRAALLLNLYGISGLKASDVKITIIFHGKATRCVLSDEVYKAKTGAASNPNLPVIRALQKAGVEVQVCGQAVNYSGFKIDDVNKGIPIALAAVVVVIHRQNDGYAYVPVH